MADKIKLLPDAIANQIAAGEVVQRPASVVKELLENAVDSGADNIRLFIKDGGTSLIQVIDNGCGMSQTDARMCWERHATSKITRADDLFRLRSFGFRGEALASIAAVAHVEMRTRRPEDDVATFIRIEGSTVKEQSAVSAPSGTQIAVKHLFFNIPARRNFLKSVPVETRHIIDEFIRVAMARPEIHFSFFSNDKEVYDLPKTELRQRITELLGKKNSQELLEVTEKHDMVNVSGYVGKPEFARKTRGEQYLFVNRRFIKDAYLNHAIVNAYDQLLPKDSFAAYVLFLEMDPAHIDINVHPTKTEIKFDDERAVYALVKAAVKKALGAYSLTPDIEFSEPNTFHPVFSVSADKSIPRVSVAPDVKVDRAYNPFDTDIPRNKRPVSNWETLFTPPSAEKTITEKPDIANQPPLITQTAADFAEPCFQFQNAFIVTRHNGRLLVIDQRAAHERILFERYLHYMANHQAATQQLLFPRTVELHSTDIILVHELADEIAALGFDIAPFGNNCIIINGVPADIAKGSEKEVFEGLLELYKHNKSQFAADKQADLARAMAQNAAIYRSTVLEQEEMQELVQALFECEHPGTNPSGKPVFLAFGADKINELLK